MGEKGVDIGSVLCKMPYQEGNERSKSDNNEEWKTCDTGHLSCVWYQDVPNWQGLNSC